MPLAFKTEASQTSFALHETKLIVDEKNLVVGIFFFFVRNRNIFLGSELPPTFFRGPTDGGGGGGGVSKTTFEKLPRLINFDAWFGNFGFTEPKRSGGRFYKLYRKLKFH